MALIEQKQVGYIKDGKLIKNTEQEFGGEEGKRVPKIGFVVQGNIDEAFGKDSFKALKSLKVEKEVGGATKEFAAAPTVNVTYTTMIANGKEVSALGKANSDENGKWDTTAIAAALKENYGVDVTPRYNQTTIADKEGTLRVDGKGNVGKETLFLLKADSEDAKKALAEKGAFYSTIVIERVEMPFDYTVKVNQALKEAGQPKGDERVAIINDTAKTFIEDAKAQMKEKEVEVETPGLAD